MRCRLQSRVRISNRSPFSAVRPLGRSAAVLGIFWILVFGQLGTARCDERAQTNRQRFAEQLSRVRIGMLASEARAIIGPPDETCRADSTPLRQGQQLWCYGVEAKGQLPTLGSVVADRNGRITAVFGVGRSTVQEVDGQERRIRGTLCSLNSIGDVQAVKFDPGSMVRAVNGLRSLGKAQGIAVIREYLRVVPYEPPQSTWVSFLVLRILFEADNGKPPPIVLGAPTPKEPHDRNLLPLFPMVIVNDVPLLVVDGYRRLGQPAPVEKYITYYEQHGILRAEPLRPDDNPQHLMAIMEHAPWWSIYDTDVERGRYIMACQLLRLTGTLHSSEPGRFSTRRIRFAKSRIREMEIGGELPDGTESRVGYG